MTTQEQGPDVSGTPRQAAIPAGESESLADYLDRTMPRSAARRAAEAKAAVEAGAGDFLSGQRKRLNPPPRQRQAGLFPAAAGEKGKV